MNAIVKTQLTTEDVATCPLCGSEKYQLLFLNYDRRYLTPGNFGTVRCEKCRLIRLSPRPTVDCIGEYYPENYGAYSATTISTENISKHRLSKLRDAIRASVLYKFGYGANEINGWQKILSPLLTQLFYRHATFGFNDLLPNYAPNGTALEVGCGNGFYLHYLKYLGWKVNGVDLSPHSVKSAKELFDIDVFLGQLDDAPFPDKSFDYIHLSHVVEHFFDPIATMKKVRSLLKPGGTVFIEVPNATGISAKISGKYWYGWDAPRHLFMFTPETLTETLKAADLSVSRMKTIMWDAFDWANTYLYEEETGKLPEIRPFVSKKDRFKIQQQRIKAKISHQLYPMAGDFIRCWATPKVK